MSSTVGDVRGGTADGVRRARQPGPVAGPVRGGREALGADARDADRHRQLLEPAGSLLAADVGLPRDRARGGVVDRDLLGGVGQVVGQVVVHHLERRHAGDRRGTLRQAVRDGADQPPVPGVDRRAGHALPDPDPVDLGRGEVHHDHVDVRADAVVEDAEHLTGEAPGVVPWVTVRPVTASPAASSSTGNAVAQSPAGAAEVAGPVATATPRDRGRRRR